MSFFPGLQRIHDAFQVPADLPGASTMLLGGTHVQPTGVAQAEGDAESTGTETPTVTMQDGSGATWTLDEALKEAKGRGVCGGS